MTGETVRIRELATGQVVEGDGVRLRPYRQDDVTDLAAACNDPVNQRFLSGLPSPVTEETARWWITEGASTAQAGGGLAYAIADPAGDRLIGGVSVGRVVTARDQAELGYWMAPWGRGRGLATAAVRALTAHAFAAGLVRLEILTREPNVASQRVALAAGYRHEGVRRGAGPTRDGGREDLLAWVRLADDPPGPTPRLLPDLPPGGLTDGVVALRPMGEDDVELLYQLCVLPEVVANRVPPRPVTRDEAVRQCQTAGSRWLVGAAAHLVVVDVTSGEAGGSLSLRYDEPLTQRAMLGASMLPHWRGRGLMTRAVRLVARWAFDTVGVARLWAGCRPENVASQRVLEKAGFHREGLQRAVLPGPENTRVDSVHYALLPADLA